MKLTKYGHSCLYIELDGKAVLFDPGVFSPVPVETITKLDYICITHEHPDHFDKEVMAQLHAKFPDVRVIAPKAMDAELHSLGMSKPDTVPAEVQLFNSRHEQIAPFGGEVPEQIGIHYGALLSHPGDSHTFSETKAILALPIVGPWGATRRAVELALELNPRIVIPIHDWFLSEQATIWYYDRLVQVLGEHGIRFVPLKAGESILLDEKMLY